jgi:DNA-binding transcriptional regulator YiaG
MSSDNAYTRTMHRALSTMGSAEQLAAALGASVAEVESWSTGLEDPPPKIFLKAIDIVAQAWSAPRTLKF